MLKCYSCKNDLSVQESYEFNDRNEIVKDIYGGNKRYCRRCFNQINKFIAESTEIEMKRRGWIVNNNTKQ